MFIHGFMSKYNCCRVNSILLIYCNKSIIFLVAWSRLSGGAGIKGNPWSQPTFDCHHTKIIEKQPTLDCHHTKILEKQPTLDSHHTKIIEKQPTLDCHHTKNNKKNSQHLILTTQK